MNKLEEAKDKLRKYFPNHTDKSKWNKSEILSLVEWLLQSTLTLDSKIEQLTKERDELKQDNERLREGIDNIIVLLEGNYLASETKQVLKQLLKKET